MNQKKRLNLFVASHELFRDVFFRVFRVFPRSGEHGFAMRIVG